MVTANYTLNWDQNVDKTGTGTSDTRTFNHSLDVKYRGFLSPIVENEIILRIEQEVKSDADPPSTIRILPEINLSYKGSYWNAGAKRTIEESNEPDTSAKIADSYFVEVFYVPPRSSLPDLKAKYTLDQSFETGTTDTSDQGVTLSSVYRPMEWIEFKGEYTRDLSDDNLNADSDTEDETIRGTVSIRHFVSDKIRVNSELNTEVTRGATLLDAGGAENQREDQTHTWKNTLSFRPFENTNVDGSYDFDLKQNLENGEHTHTTNWKVSASQGVGIFNLHGEFNRAITDTRHTSDDNEKTEDTWTVDGSVKFSKHLNFTLRHQKTDTTEIHPQDPNKDTTSGSISQSGTWSGVITPFWRASATYDRTDTIDREVTTTIDTKYSFQSTFDFHAINLLFDPTYDITRTEDRQLTPPEETETRDFKFKIAWKVFSTDNAEAKIDHTYGRKTDSGAGTIERTDNSSGNFLWKEPLPGWNVGIDVTRSATDTSEDDQPPDITSTFGLKVDYKYERFDWNMNYKYDKNKLTDDSETFDFRIGWMASDWDVSLTYSFTKTFSEELNEGYSIGLAFRYSL